MFDGHPKSLLYLNRIMRTSSIPWLRVLSRHSLRPLEANYSTATSTAKKLYFRMDYLVNNCGFSPETASELSKQVSFLNSEKPDAVLKLFRNLSISDNEMRDAIKKVPRLLSSNPVKNISPKLEFFKSKGASSSQLAQIMTTHPWLLQGSLENNIIPRYDFLKSFLHSDERTIKSIQRWPRLITDHRLEHRIKLLQNYGVPDSKIILLLRHWPGMTKFNEDELKTKADELKELGFDPLKTSFIEALRTKLMLSKASWERKVELYRKWGWSDEALRKAFIKFPSCMLKSETKIDAVMEFFVNQLGWGSSLVAQHPLVLRRSLEKVIIPRAAVLQFLQSKGLIKRNASGTPFTISEEMFRQKFVNRFKVEAPQLLKLYEKKLNLPR